jgi:hypothetical protein
MGAVKGRIQLRVQACVLSCECDQSLDAYYLFQNRE